MPTVTRKTSKKKATKPAAKAPRVVPAGVVSETFTTDRQPQQQVTVERGHVQLYVNSCDNGQVDARNTTFEQFILARAQDSGIRNFSVYADGAKANTSMNKLPAASFRKIEIVSKDARG